jgi:hypothetical protein
MSSDDRETMIAHISEANRVLILLDSMGPRDSRRSISRAVRDAHRAYDALLASQETIRLTVGEASEVQNLADRLKARLRFFGDKVEAKGPAVRPGPPTAANRS